MTFKPSNPKLPAAPKPWSPPKEPMGRGMTSAQAGRAQSSGYGKVFRIGGGESAIPKQKSSDFTAKME